MGARKFVLTNLMPLWCLPAVKNQMGTNGLFFSRKRGPHFTQRVVGDHDDVFEDTSPAHFVYNRGSQ